MFEGILQKFFFAFVNFHPKLYCTGVLETRLDIDGLKFSAQLETVPRVLLGREKNKGAWYVHLDYLSKVVCFLHSPVCEVCLRATSVTSLGSDRE